MNVVSLFSGCGGLDLGFRRAGFEVPWGNEYDRTIWETYEKNHVDAELDRRSISEIKTGEIPDCDGIIGGPPCQSWSEAGAKRGIDDPRGQLFLDFVRILRDKQPLFFLAENVSGILAQRHSHALHFIISCFEEAGYNVVYELLDANNFDVPQTRKRVIFVGYRLDIGRPFLFPAPSLEKPDLENALWDLKDSALPAVAKNRANERCDIPNHEYMTGGFSTIYMSRNRVRLWSEPSFTIQAGGRHAPIHPQANRMINVGKDKFIFDPNSKGEYRRLSVRECARIQTFPDDFIYYYDRIADGYKMVGNAVPVNFAFHLASKIYTDLTTENSQTREISECYRLKLCVAVHREMTDEAS